MYINKFLIFLNLICLTTNLSAQEYYILEDSIYEGTEMFTLPIDYGKHPTWLIISKNGREGYFTIITQETKSSRSVDYFSFEGNASVRLVNGEVIKLINRRYTWLIVPTDDASSPSKREIKKAVAQIRSLRRGMATRGFLENTYRLTEKEVAMLKKSSISSVTYKINHSGIYYDWLDQPRLLLNKYGKEHHRDTTQMVKELFR